jgi:hypothetical protein
MARPTLLILITVAMAFVLAAGCTSPAPGGTQNTTVSTTMVTGALPAATAIEATPSPEEVTNVSTTVTESPAPVSTTTGQVEATPVPSPLVTTITPAVAPTPREIYYGNLAIFMDREGYLLINFEDIGYPILYPGDKFIVRITADHAILAYVIRTYDTPLLRTSDGLPTYDKYDRTYDYGRLLPILKLENIYDGGDEFTVKDLGKYTLVLDTRLSTIDYRFMNEVTTVSVRILKVG